MFEDEYGASETDEGAESYDEAPESGEGAPAVDDFTMEAQAAFDTSLPVEERVAALKNAIMACMGTDYGSEEPPKEKGGLALLFAEPKKK